MTELFQAQANDLPAISTLWTQCFDDTAQEVAQFFEAMFASISVYAARSDGKLSAMLCALPTVFSSEDGEETPTAYLYAVCTAENRRGQGLSRRLLHYAEDELQKSGFGFTALVPSSEQLFAFYRHLGYETAFFRKHYSLPAAPSTLLCKKITADSYRNLRQMQLYGDFLDYSEPFLALQQTACERSGAGLYRLETADGVYCAVAVKQEQTLLCKELLPDCPTAAAALAAQLGCAKVSVSTADGDAPFGMMKALRGQKLPKNAYLGLALD